jgi:hypothetical protein
LLIRADKGIVFRRSTRGGQGIFSHKANAIKSVNLLEFFAVESKSLGAFSESVCIGIGTQPTKVRNR